LRIGVIGRKTYAYIVIRVALLLVASVNSVNKSKHELTLQ